jgi:SAM-dependent methyltransferase
MEAYAEDLAYIHDVGFGGFAKSSAPGLLETLRKKGVARGLVVDLGCGSGLWARALCDAGYAVRGIDISKAMIKMAKQRVPEGTFQAGSFLKAKLPPCDAVTALGECLNYLFDRSSGLSELGRLFRRAYAALRPGGVFIFDIAEPGRGAGPRQRYREGPDWAVLVEIDEDPKARRLTRRISVFRKIGDLCRRSQEVHELRLYLRSDILKALRRVGFQVRTLRGYGQQRFPEAYVGFLARKP